MFNHHRLLLVAMLATAALLSAQPRFPTDPAKAELFTTDLDTFAQVFAERLHHSDPVQLWQNAYLDAGSLGMQEFISRHRLDAAMLEKAVQADPARYAALPDFIANRAEFATRYTELLQDYKTVLPQAMFPPTYLLIGANRGIAQASAVGQLVTIERALDRPAILHRMCLHELTHFQQAVAMGMQKYVNLYREPNNMLGLILREGGAEFITYLTVGETTQPKTLTYLLENEAELKSRFRRDLAAQDPSYWLWDSPESGDRPILLGYALGFRIWQNYYEQADDKGEALVTLLTQPDPEAVLLNSGYLNE